MKLSAIKKSIVTAGTIKLNTNEEAFALRNAMHSLALETGKVRPSDVYTMLNLNVPYDPDMENDAFWTITEIRHIQIQKLEDMGWCLKIPMPSAHEAKKEGVPGCDSLAEKMNMSPDELELRVRITDAINGKFSDTTVVTIDYIGKRLQAAYSRGLKYDVSDLREHVMELAKNSHYHRDRCCKAVEQMRFKSDGVLVNIPDWKPERVEDNRRLKELVERDYYESKSDSSVRTITNAWLYCSSIYDMRAMDLRARHIKGVMEEGKALIKGEERAATAGTKARIKSMFNLMLDYALEYEIVEKNYARTFDVSGDIIREREESKRGHIPYSDDEIQKLWDNVENMNWVDVVLIQCYSGWRPQELGLIEVENVNITDWTFVGGMKTEAGTNRIVPIHSRIRPLVKRRYDEAIALGSKYLINCTDTHTHRSSNMLTYDKYQQRYNKLRDALGLNPLHRAHDGRNHFITKAKKYGVDEYAIKYMVGHAITDVTEKVYTKREDKVQ